jgi:hypothetical protein
VLTAQQMIDAIKSFDDSQKKELGRALSRLAAEPGFEGVIHSAASTAGLDAISNVLKEAKPELLGPLLSKASQVLPEERRVDLARQITGALSPAKQESLAEEIQQGLKGPSQSVNDRLWLVVVSVFSFVLVGSFLTLAVGVFIPASGAVKIELVFAAFTSVVGFLAGLFAPSPMSTRARRSES